MTAHAADYRSDDDPESVALHWLEAMVWTALPRQGNRRGMVAVVAVLATCATADLPFKVSVNEIVRMAGVGHGTVRRTRRWLIANGWLKVTRRRSGQTPTEFRLTFPQDRS